MPITSTAPPVAVAGAPDRVHRVRLGGVRDAGVVQTHRQVAEPLPCRHHDAPGEALVGDIPEPAGVGAVRHPRVDAHDERRLRSGHQVKELVPSRGVLRQHQPRTDVAEVAHGEAPRHLVHRRHGLERRRGVHPAGLAGHGGHQGVREVEPPRQLEVDPDRPAVGPHRLGRVHPGRARGSASGSGRANPHDAHDHVPSPNVMRSSHEGHPTASSCQRRPAPTQCTSRAAACAPHHERVIGVGDDVRMRRGRQRGTPTTRHHAHLVHPVELVTREVQQRPRRSPWSRSAPAGDTPRPPRAPHAAHPSRPARPRGPAACWTRSRCSRRRHRADPRPTVTSLVVVVLPFVPVTSTT